MTKVNIKKKELIVGLALMISSVCHSQVNNGNILFAGMPSESIVRIGLYYNGYRQIFRELPNNGLDTLWVKGLVKLPTWKILDGEIDPNFSVLSDMGNSKKIIANNGLYPKDAYKKGIEGKVEISCIVEKDGSLADLSILKPLFPSIDEEALRLLSKTKLTPCIINNIRLKCRHKLALSFAIEEVKGNKTGLIYIVNTDDYSDGVSKRYKYDITKTQTTTTTKTDRYGWTNTNSYTSGQWHSSLEIDIPQNNLNLEEILCELLFDKRSKSIEVGGEKFAKKFSGKLRGKEFKGLKETNLEIKAHVLGYKPEKYYSYGYDISLGYDTKKVSHCMIYDIRQNRLLSVSDVLTEEMIPGIFKMIGASSADVVDVGLNNYFLYLGKKEENDVITIATIGLSKENWDKFTPLIHDYIGNKEALHATINENEFIIDKELGIMPEKLICKIVQYPSIDKKYIDRNINIPEEIRNSKNSSSVNISYIIEKDGTLSNIEVKKSGDDTMLHDEILRILSNIPKCQPLTISFDGPVRTYHFFTYKIGDATGECLSK